LAGRSRGHGVAVKFHGVQVLVIAYGWQAFRKSIGSHLRPYVVGPDGGSVETEHIPIRTIDWRDANLVDWTHLGIADIL